MFVDSYEQDEIIPVAVNVSTLGAALRLLLLVLVDRSANTGARLKDLFVRDEDRRVAASIDARERDCSSSCQLFSNPAPP